MKVLVTGGAGFVGSFLVTALLKQGFTVRIFDSLEPQVHGTKSSNLQGLLNAHSGSSGALDIQHGDMRDASQISTAITSCDAIIHLAAQVGVGQSMYQVQKYVDQNTGGTAILLDLLASGKHSVKKLLVASSMSIYGEGAYDCSSCGEVYPSLRAPTQMRDGDWELKCPKCGNQVVPKPTGEHKPLQPTSIYAITKRDQEEMCLTVGRAYGIPTVALRFFNIYGPRQSLNNPYTGVAAIFSSRLMNRRAPVIYEDGNQTRDFVHVSDVVQAILLALSKEAANFECFNVGTGRPTSVNAIALMLGRRITQKIAPQIEQQFREGDIRHCYGDISKIVKQLGYTPRVQLEDGIGELIDWVRTQNPEDRFEEATAELVSRGLAH